MKLVIISEPGKGKEFDIQEGSNLIGRWDPNDKSFPEIDLEEEDIDAKISRRHCVIQKTSDQAVLEDALSLNGTYLNGKKLEEGEKIVLQEGDELLLGKILLKFVAV
jgi:pSer/pThr/pTyr-binding forkhead associated (FHA) protein